MPRAEQTLVLVLRLCAAVLLVALGAVVMPFSWMAAVHAGLGLGELPDVPLLGYLTRSISGLYAFHGAMMWFMSRDVRRFAPLLRFQAWCSLVFGTGLLILDLAVGMPWFWTLVEGPFVVAIGVVVLALLQRLPAPP
jgi:hypothetical protein